MASYQNPYQSPYQPTYGGYGVQQPMQNVPTQAQPMQQSLSVGVYVVKGKAAVNSFFVSPGATALFIDSEAPKIYVKSVGVNGVPILQTYKLGDDEPEETAPDYITRGEFEKKIAELTSTKKGKTKDE